MNKALLIVCVLVTALLTGCTSSNTVVAKGINLSKYKYVSVLTDDANTIPPQLVQHQIQLYDAIEESGMTLIAPYRIHELTPQQQSTVLLASAGVNARPDEFTAIVVNFSDYATGRPVVSCQSSFLTEVSTPALVKQSLEKLGKEIAKTFH